MPEGPEIRCIADGISDEILNKDLREIFFYNNSKVYRDRQLYSSDYEIQYDDINDCYKFTNTKKCLSVTSYGKKLCILFETFAIISALNMEGRWLLTKDKDTSISVHFSDNTTLYFKDIDKRANISIINYDSAAFEHIFSDVGYDIQSDDVTYEYFNEAITKKKFLNKKLYDVLLDQSCVSGIGNYLRCEIIYHAKIRYDIKISEMTNEELFRLFNSIKYIMQLSYERGGLTLSSYTNLYGIVGTYEPMVYMRKNTKNGETVNVCLCSKKRKFYYCVY